MKELGDLSPHWDGLRHDVINHCHCLIGCYQETLAELDKLSGEVIGSHGQVFTRILFNVSYLALI